MDRMRFYARVQFWRIDVDKPSFQCSLLASSSWSATGSNRPDAEGGRQPGSLLVSAHQCKSKVVQVRISCHVSNLDTKENVGNQLRNKISAEPLALYFFAPNAYFLLNKLQL